MRLLTNMNSFVSDDGQINIRSCCFEQCKITFNQVMKD